MLRCGVCPAIVPSLGARNAGTDDAPTWIHSSLISVYFNSRSGYRSGCIEYSEKKPKKSKKYNIPDIRKLLTKQKPRAFRRPLITLLAK